MIATQTLKMKRVDNADINEENSYRYGKLIKTETNYISNKEIHDGLQKESLEAIYLLTFLDNKTNKIESFQSCFLPDNIGENYFYFTSDGKIENISTNKNDFIKLALERNSINETSDFIGCLLFIVSIFGLIVSTFDKININGLLLYIFQSFFILGILMSIIVCFLDFSHKKDNKKRKTKIKSDIDALS